MTGKKLTEALANTYGNHLPRRAFGDAKTLQSGVQQFLFFEYKFKFEFGKQDRVFRVSVCNPVKHTYFFSIT